jgi:hypothetical protein
MLVLVGSYFFFSATRRHGREVDHQTDIADRRSDDVVAAAAHGDGKGPLAAQPNRGKDIRYPPTSGR